MASRLGGTPAPAPLTRCSRNSNAVVREALQAGELPILMADDTAGRGLADQQFTPEEHRFMQGDRPRWARTTRTRAPCASSCYQLVSPLRPHASTRACARLRRRLAFMTEIRRLARGQVALDLGTGPQAVLAVEAALAGATLEYAVEMDAQSARMATEHVKDLESVGTAAGRCAPFAVTAAFAQHNVIKKGQVLALLHSHRRPRPHRPDRWSSFTATSPS